MKPTFKKNCQLKVNEKQILKKKLENGFKKIYKQPEGNIEHLINKVVSVKLKTLPNGKCIYSESVAVSYGAPKGTLILVSCSHNKRVFMR